MNACGARRATTVLSVMKRRATTSLAATSLVAVIVFVVGALGVEGHSGLGRFDTDILRYFADNPYDIVINIADLFTEAQKARLFMSEEHGSAAAAGESESA